MEGELKQNLSIRLIHQRNSDTFLTYQYLKF